MPHHDLNTNANVVLINNKYESGKILELISMGNSIYEYCIDGIEWENPDCTLPEEAVIRLSSHLVESGPEDCEPVGFDDQFEQMDDDEIEEFWENYEPSIEAQIAWERSWDDAIIATLESQYNQKVKSYGGFNPAA